MGRRVGRFMKCPKCGSKMLEFPCLVTNPELEYWLCLDCRTRILRKCKWMKRDGTCRKMNKPCNLTSDKEIGYVFCPQIREWGEQSASWVAAQNREYEEKHKVE